jgi:hypothetical protein
MKKDLGYYQKWYNKWIKILHYLWWECDQSFKVKCLANSSINRLSQLYNVAA